MKEEYDKVESVYETAEKRLATDAKALDETLREQMLKITIGSNVTIQPALRDFEDCPLPGVASVADDDRTMRMMMITILITQEMQYG